MYAIQTYTGFISVLSKLIWNYAAATQLLSSTDGPSTVHAVQPTASARHPITQTPSSGLRHPSLEEGTGKRWLGVCLLPKLPALVYDTIGSRKLSANEQFFVGAQTVVSLLHKAQIISDVCFITDHVAYSSSNKTQIVWIETELFSYPGWMRHMFTCVLWR